MKRDPVPPAEPSGFSQDWLRQQLAAIPDPVKTDQDHTRLRELASVLPADATPTEPLLDAVFDLGQRLHHLGHDGELVTTSRIAVRLARELGDPTRLRRALSINALALTYVGEPADAAAALIEALVAAKESGEPASAAPVWHNFGIMFQTLAQYDSARRCAEIALSLTQNTRFAPYLDHLALASLALCDLHFHKYRDAVPVARRALEAASGLDGEAGLFSRAIARHVLVRAMLALGDVDQARKNIPPSTGKPGGALTNALIFDRLTLGMVRSFGERPADGLADLKQTVELCKVQFPAHYPEAIGALVQALEATGRADEALVYLHDMLARTRVRLSEQLRAQLPAETPDVTIDGYVNSLTSKAATLHVAVARRINELQKSAVIGSEQSGHDRIRVFRVGRLTELFALELGLDPDQAARLGFATTVMDAGLAVLPRGLALKQRRLSDAERRMVHEHVTVGADLLSASRLSVLEPCIPVARFHHERWDGRGPLGLSGAAIPVEARIAALADAFDALTHDRPWRDAMTASAALRTIAEGGGAQFDPQLAPRFVAFVKAMYWDHDKLEDFLAESAARYDLPYLSTRDEIDRLMAAGGTA